MKRPPGRADDGLSSPLILEGCGFDAVLSIFHLSLKKSQKVCMKRKIWFHTDTHMNKYCSHSISSNDPNTRNKKFSAL
jgi:hypothetical protein